MRWSLPLLLIALAGCGGAAAPPPEPLEVPVVIEAPTPPPTADTDLDAMLPVEPPLPPGARPPERKPAPPPAPEPTAVPAGAKPLTFEKVVLAGSVVDRAPKGVASSFSDGAEVNCWMSVKNPGPKRRLRTQWFHEGARKSSIPVTVGGPTWRTWTSRPVYGLGSWRVDIVDEAGGVLHSLPFEVK